MSAKKMFFSRGEKGNDKYTKQKKGFHQILDVF